MSFNVEISNEKQKLFRNGSDSQEINICPEHVIGALPFSIFNPAYEKNYYWEPFEISEEIKSIIASLDNSEMTNVHKVGLIYIPHDCMPTL